MSMAQMQIFQDTSPPKLSGQARRLFISGAAKISMLTAKIHSSGGEIWHSTILAFMKETHS